MTWTVESLRAFEEEVRYVYLQGRIQAPVHLSRGNEKQLIEIFQAVGPEDWVFSSYRSHYAALLRGVPRERVMAEILAGHSIHLEFPEFKFYSSAIVGGCLPIALGTALGIKRRGGSANVWCFVGDMATFTGAFRECLAYANGFHLPITFVTECNNFSTNTPTDRTWGEVHPHLIDGKVKKDQMILDGKLEKDQMNGHWSYCYDREFPHYGVGVRVDFDQAEKATVEERSDVMG